MGKLFNSVTDMAENSIKNPLKGFEQLGKGDFSGAIDQWGHLPGDANRDASEIANSVGIRGWVGDHPNESLGALAGAVLGGWAAAGAGAGAAGGGAGTAGAGTGAFAGQSAALASTPMSSFASLGGTGAGSSAMAYAPTQSAVLGAGGSTAGGTGALAYAPTQSATLAGTGAQGIGTGAGTSAMTYAPTQSTALGGAGSGVAPNYGAGVSSGSSGVDINQLIQGMNQMSKAEEERTKGPAAPKISAPTGKFNFKSTLSDYDKAQQLLQQTMGTNKFTQNKFTQGR